MAESDPGEWVSLDVVRAELDLEIAAQVKRSESADSRGGVLLGSSGALAALAANTKSVYVLPGAVAAAVAAILAAGVLLPRKQFTINPGGLRTYYAMKEPETTQRWVLDNRVLDFEANDKAIDDKIKRLARAVRAVVIAVVLVVVGFGAKLVADAISG
jgi:asparagine synthetase B (glutamine-hydrolysing)